jgi:hypothetical protein
MPDARAAALPLLVLPPARLCVLNPVQSLQVMLSLQFTRAGHGRRCAALASLMPSTDALHAFQPFMLTLLARRVAAGQMADPVAERHAVEDIWRDPLVNRRWQRLALRLTAEDCERIGRVAAERGLAGSGVRWLKDEAATEGWALGSGGYALGSPTDIHNNSPKMGDAVRHESHRQEHAEAVLAAAGMQRCTRPARELA